MSRWKRLVKTTLVLLMAGFLAGGVHAASEWTGYDFDGETLLFQSRWGNVTPLGPRGAFDWYNPDARLQAHIGSVEEMFNVKIEFVEPGDWWAPWGGGREQMVISATLAGDIAFHYTDVPWSFAHQQAAAGVLHKLDEVLEPDFYDRYPAAFRWPSLDAGGFGYAGNVYGFESVNFLREAIGVIWNIDLFEEEGLPSLYDLYDAGEWTWDALRGIAERATKDTTGDGEIDQIGLTAQGGVLLQQLAASWGAHAVREVEGRMAFAFDEPAALDAFEYGAALYRDGLFNTALHTSVDGDYAMAITFVHRLQQLSEQAADRHGVVPIPRGPGVEEYVVDLWSHWMGVIPAMVEQPRAVIEVVQALRMLTAPYIDLDEWEAAYWSDVPGFARYVPDERSLTNWQWMMGQASFAFSPDAMTAFAQSGVDWSWPNLFTAMTADDAEQSAAVWIGERRSALQLALDELYQQ